MMKILFLNSLTNTSG